MPFQFTPYRNPLTDSIAERIAQGGAIEAQRAYTAGNAAANAALQSGNAWAGAIRGVGEAIGQVPGQIAAVNRSHTVDQLNQLKLADATREQQGQQAVATMLQGDHAPPDAVGPRQPSYLDDNGLFDVPKITARLAQIGYGDQAPALVQGAERINEAIQKAQAQKQQTAQQHTILYGQLADGALQLATTGLPIDQAMDFVVQPALMTGLLTSKDYATVKAQIGALPPEAQTAALTGMRDQAARLAPTKTLGKDQIEHDLFGRVVASNVVPDAAKGKQSENFLLDGKPVKGVFDPNTGRYTYNGEDVTARVQPVPPQATPKGKQAESFLLDGQAVKGVFDPDTGTYTYNGQDVTGRVKPIPPASVTIHNDQKNAPAMPAWALDDSRPSGAEANTFDPTLRMTPNGLHQAALNYLATGQFPPTGRGSDPIAVAQRAAIVSKVGAIAAASGLDEPALRAFYKANGQSLAQQQKMQDAVQGFMATADKNAALLQESLKKIPDTGSPLFNQPLRAFADKVKGDPNLAQFATYLQSVQNEYARIITQPNLAGQLTDAARVEAEKLVRTDATVPQLLASLRALQAEGTNRLQSVGEQIQRIQQRMQTGPAGTTSAPQTTPAPSGTIRARDPQGHLHEAPAGTPLPAGWTREP